MKNMRFICAAMVAALLPGVAHADDPRDATMRSAAARARDSEETRQLNVRAGAAITGPRWRTVRARGDDAGYAAASHDHDRDMARYASDRARYEREMAEWRRAVAACRAGDYAACDN
ncbi:hypothetical protein [uncultured Sphingomonas sp.]|uniref:hypothetical protein n=1 Tax=uncultured Sphingomonas sp. TaxID=158754 RepID=UPI002623BFA2|nr:hypothetical protein [uncultured Sphingomonas sp.]